MLVFFTASSAGSTLEIKPWFGDEFEFNFQSAFTYSRFNKVEGASTQLRAPINDRDILLDLGLTLLNGFDIQLEGEFAKTNAVNWALRSGALQARMGFLDDISGDPISLVVGVNVRGAPHHLLRDVSTPYAAEFNAELTCSIGKEWSQGPDWKMRAFGCTAIGQANRGYPWLRQTLAWQYNLSNVHAFTAFAEGDFGFGGKQHVDVRHFDGWAKIQHQSIDLGATYAYTMSVYGTFSVSYAHRIFAHNFPEHVNFFTLAYSIPFSLF